MGAKVLSQKKKSSHYQLRSAIIIKLKMRRYNDETDVGLEAAIF
jgi:hypothetical protein